MVGGGLSFGVFCKIKTNIATFIYFFAFSFSFTCLDYIRDVEKVSLIVSRVFVSLLVYKSTPNMVKLC